MKLVELLAKELTEWADTTVCYVQDPDGMVWPCIEIAYKDGGVWGGDKGLIDQSDDAKHFEEAEVCDDHETAIVTHAQWQAERDRQKGGEWKRHRGGKQPVADDVIVEYKTRSGYTDTWLAKSLSWSHEGSEGDLMKYRIISQPQAEEVEMNVFCGKDVKLEYAFGSSDTDPKDLDWKVIGSARVDDITDITSSFKTGQIDSPIKWRDTIIHCQAIIEDCEREIAKNENLLALEGFALIPAMTPVMGVADVAIPLSDWMVGDIVEVISVDTFCDPECKVGDQMPIIATDDRDGTVKVVAGAWGDEDNYRFIRRP